MSHKYALRYDFKTEMDPAGYSKEDAGDKGLADSLLCISILEPSDGSYSQAVFSVKGKEKRDLTQKEIYKAWLLLGLSLHDQGELTGWPKDFVKTFAEIVRTAHNHSDNCATLKGCNHEK